MDLLIPAAHPGYIVLDQYDANIAKLAADVAARGTSCPAYLCQRDGIENARPICTALPGPFILHAPLEP